MEVPYGHQNNDGDPIIVTMITDSYIMLYLTSSFMYYEDPQGT